ncbi:aldehyde dehydrogenase family protein [Streptomyces sp. NPDC005811]|uniref:aldehyde dehydrogenase family protein n=1 Tax=Streptomyces sp. NPDC005811 TaxID=3154565 RepID=UPI0033C5DE45
MIASRCSHIAGRWVEGEKPCPVTDPASETEVCVLSAAPLQDVRKAVTEARRSFDDGVWTDRPARERAQVVRAFLDRLESMRDELVATLVAEAGQPVPFAETTQVEAGLALARATVDLYLSLPEEEATGVPVGELVRGRVALSVRRHEPVGVITAITPYNAALLMALQKVVPALLAGNSVVLRPSPLTPLSSLSLGVAAEDAGLPPGVLSVVIEDGPAGAELLTSHLGLDLVSFTGSTAVGRRILAQAAPTVKQVALELGGKSAQIYLPDARHRVGPGAAAVVAMTSGQACSAATRMLVPEERKEEVLATVSAVHAGLPVGPPTAPGTMLGPVISDGQRARCEEFVALVLRHGGRVVTGGGRPAGLERGYAGTTWNRPSSTCRTTATPPPRRRASDRCSR